MEEAAEIFDTEAYTEIPIVNNHHRLVGVLRKDDLFRVSIPASISLQAALRRSQ
jgi:Mg/Co/Ni transporter MgtE